MPNTTTMNTSIVQPPQYGTSGGNQYVWDPITGTWKLAGAAGQPVTPNAPPTSIVPPAGVTQPAEAAPASIISQPPVGETPLPPPVAPPAPAVVQQPSADQPSSLLSGLSFDEELKKLLAQDPRVAELEKAQYEAIQRDLKASDFGPEDQNILDQIKASAQAAYSQNVGTRTRQAEKEASAIGLRKSTQVVRDMARIAEQENSTMAQTIMQGEIAVRTRALERNAERRAVAVTRARDFIQALDTKNVALVQALLQAHQTDVEAELSRDQLDLQRRVIEENISLSRDRFTEEQRAAMKAEKFTDQQIAQAEEQALWERSYRERQQQADIGLAQQNYELQNRQMNIAELRNAADISLADRALQLQTTLGLSAANIDQQKINQMKTQLENEFNIAINGQELQRQIAAGQLDLAKLVQTQTFTMAERQQQMAEIRNNADISLADRTFSLQQQLQLTASDLEGEKFKAYVKQLEREYGLSLNEFALKDTIQTGQLNLDILNSQRKYDLDKESDRQKWLATEAARATQEKLGMSEIEMKLAISGNELSVAREKQILERYMFDAGLTWDREKLQKQIDEARRKRKGSFLGSVFKAIVGAGAIIGGIVTGGVLAAPLIAAGASIMSGSEQKPEGGE